MTVRSFGSGPELVWIHGLGEWSVSFEPLANQLAGYTHVLVDLPGYGRSPWPDREQSLVELATHLAQWLATRPPAILAGHSMGGVLATLIAEQLAVRAVVNLDGNLTRGDCTYSARGADHTRDDFLSGGFERMRLDVFVAGTTDPVMRGYFAALSAASPATFHRHACELVALSECDSLAPRFAGLACPVLFLAGVPGGICERSRGELDRLAIHWRAIEQAGHWLFVEKPGACAAQIAQFLSENLAS